VVECTKSLGLYRFTVQIHHDSGFDLPLLFNENETSRLMTVTKVNNYSYPISLRVTDKNQQFRRHWNYGVDSIFKLPREIRDRIYEFCIPTGKWSIGDVDAFNTTFAGAIGDPTGFYFPLSKDLSILRTSKRLREEALPIAYRRTSFHLDDIDDFIKVAASIGDIGRANVESVEFSWESRSDLQWRMDENYDLNSDHSQLPSLHALRCVQLLKQCNRLKLLRIYFENDLISNMSFADLRVDPGIRELSSVRGIRKVEVGSLVCEPLDRDELVWWLKRKMESTVEEDEEDS
jgi:hypothetical protein